MAHRRRAPPRTYGWRLSVGTYGVLALLLGAAALSWAALLWPSMDEGMKSGLTMGLAAPAFMAIWTIMMIAMMFPTAAPMILTFHAIASRRRGGAAFLSTSAFVAGYLLLWSLSGLAAYGLARGAEAATAALSIAPALSARFGGALLIAAGLYQLTPIKNICLSKCRAPVDFIMTSWRSGTPGAVKMGWRHGLYCFGCCWLLFAILFPLGTMNIAAMASITLLVFAEKALPWGRWGLWASGGVIILYGVAVIVTPQILSTYASSLSMDMQNMGMDMTMPGSADQERRIP